MVATGPVSPPQVLLLSSEVGDSGEMVTQRQEIANFDIRVPAFAMPLFGRPFQLRPHSD